jgi:ketosteroid isomerase-like protein
MTASEAQPPSDSTRSIVEAYISAYRAKDARAYLALFSNDADYVDYAVQVHAKIGQLREELVSSFHREGFRLVFHSYFVSEDGQFAALRGTYSDRARSGDPASVPIVSILQMAGPKIAKEALYYDGSLFKRHSHAA